MSTPSFPRLSTSLLQFRNPHAPVGRWLLALALLFGALLGPATQTHAASVSLTQATADFSQTAYRFFNVAEAADGIVDGVTGWAVQTQEGQTHVAVFETVGDVGFSGGTTLQFTLFHAFTITGFQSLAHFRLSVTTDPRSQFADGLASNGDVTANWVELTPTLAVAANGSTLTIEPDNSIRVSGQFPSTDTYTVQARTSLTGITGIRLEALAEPSLPGGGPGRASHGNFVLSEISLTATQSNPAPSAPTITPINDQTTTQDVPASGIPFTIQDADTPLGSLILFASSSNESVVPRQNIFYSGTGSLRFLSVIPASGAIGSTLITLRVFDGAFSATTSFTLTVFPRPANPPAIAPISDRTVMEGSGPVAVTVFISDTDSDLNTITLATSSSVPAVVPPQDIVAGGSGGTRSLTITPAPGAIGSSIITVVASDGNASSSTTFRLTVTQQPPMAPTISAIPDQTTTEGVALTGIPFTVQDTSTPAHALAVTARSSVQELLPDSAITVTGSGTNRFLSLTPTPGLVGTTVLTVTVSDGVLTASVQFRLLVAARRPAPPILSAIPNQTTFDGTTLDGVLFTLEDADTPVDSLTLTTSSSQQGIVADGGITIVGTGTTRSLRITPTPGATGVTRIAVRATDGQSLAVSEFDLQVLPHTSTPPVLSRIRDQSIQQGLAISGVPFTVDDGDSPLESLVVTATSSAQSIVPDAGIRITGTGRDRLLSVTPAADALGSAIITLRATDGIWSGFSSFQVTVTARPNRAPTISTIPDYSIVQGEVVRNVEFQIGDPDGPVGSLVVTASSSDPSLLRPDRIVVSGSGATRTLLITPEPDAFGQATVSVAVSDLSAVTTRSFVLTVTPRSTATVAVEDTVASANTPVDLKLNLNSAADIRAVGVSLTFDATKASFLGLVTGRFTPAWGVSINTNGAGAGRLGLSFSAAGPPEAGSASNLLATLRFAIKDVTVGSALEFAFSDQPVAREVIDATSSTVPTTYLSGRIQIVQPSYEGDVSPVPPRPSDDRVTTLDWVQVGRYAAGLEDPPTGTAFQRADSAPRLSGKGNLVLGDGAITVADYVQARRYSLGLDPLTFAGGPTNQTVHTNLSSPPVEGMRRVVVRPSAPDSTGTVWLEVGLEGQGGEAAVGLSVQVDRATAEALTAAVPSGGSTLIANFNQVDLGIVGLIVSLPQSFNPSTEVYTIARIAVRPVGGDPTGVRFKLADHPVSRELVDESASPLNVGFEAVIVLPPPVLTASISNTQLLLTWSGAPGGFQVQSSSTLTPGSWQPVLAEQLRLANEVQVRLPLSQARQFFRLVSVP